MDIGNQQRVIIVELDRTETPDLAPVEPEPEFVEAGQWLVGDWPLPLDINVEPVS
ncbi:MAG: hypothetical protein GY926_14495 [bacterium]|nr:hypothetical protein [bacterium]MCP4966429.1 hypothetical protein [bacterium]